MKPSTTLTGSETTGVLAVGDGVERDVEVDRMMLRYENKTARIAGATRAAELNW
jgi:hypothetical protein